MYVNLVYRSLYHSICSSKLTQFVERYASFTISMCKSSDTSVEKLSGDPICLILSVIWLRRCIFGNWKLYISVLSFSYSLSIRASVHRSSSASLCFCSHKFLNLTFLAFVDRWDGSADFDS